MAPSRTRMRSAASCRSVVPPAGSTADVCIGLRALLLRAGMRARVLPGRPQPQQVADRVDEVGPIHRVEVEVSHAVVDEVEHLFGGYRGSDELARRGIIFQAIEAL